MGEVVCNNSASIYIYIYYCGILNIMNTASCNISRLWVDIYHASVPDMGMTVHRNNAPGWKTHNVDGLPLWLMTSRNIKLPVLLALCEWNASVTEGHPSKGLVMRSFDGFFVVSSKAIKQTINIILIWVAPTLMWRHCNLLKLITF